MSEKQTQKKNRTAKEQHHSTHETMQTSPDFVANQVLTLQRAVGNQSTRQFIIRNSAPKVVQRAETGIRTTSATNHYAQAVFDYANATGNQTKTIAQFKTMLADSVNTELRGAGSHPITIVNGAPGASGEFDFAIWAIELNEATAFPSATTVADLTHDQVSETANTIYHEARHSEQWFRIARNRAGKALAQNATAGERQTAAATIANDMGIPANVALEACNRPLYASWGARFGGGTDQKVAEAEAWEASIYGVNSTYRDEIVLGDFNDNVEKLNALLQEANNFYANFDTMSTDDQKKATKAAKKKVKEAKPIKNDLVDGMTNVVQPEINRLDALATKTPVDTTMLNHLKAAKSKLQTIRSNFRGSIPDKLEKAATASQEMEDELYQAYLDLPEEADAWPAGDAAGARYDALVTAASAPVGGG